MTTATWLSSINLCMSISHKISVRVSRRRSHDIHHSTHINTHQHKSTHINTHQHKSTHINIHQQSNHVLVNVAITRSHDYYTTWFGPSREGISYQPAFAVAHPIRLPNLDVGDQKILSIRQFANRSVLIRIFNLHNH